MISEQRLSQPEVNAELDKLVGALLAYEPIKIVLHGSLARGDWNRASDIDLIIVKQTDQPFLERIGDVLDLCQSRLNVEPLVYTPEELETMLDKGNSFLERAFAEGRVLYESQSSRS